MNIKPLNGVYLSSNIKENIQRDLRKYSCAGIVAEIIDLKYLYLEPTVTAYYNTSSGPSSNFVKDSIVRNITIYSDSTELNKFEAGLNIVNSRRLLMMVMSPLPLTSPLCDEKRHGSTSQSVC